MSKIDALLSEIFEFGGWKNILEGLKNTFLIAFIGLAIGIVIGILIAFVKVSPKTKTSKAINVICDIYVGFFRGTPIIVQLLLFYFAIPALLNFKIDRMLCAILTFGFNSGAYMSEMMRAGLNSVDRGQTEAGRSLGFSHFGTLFRFVLPQAIKNIVPTMGNELIALIKETSVVSFIGAVDITKVFKDFATSSYEYIITYIALAVIYLIIITILTVLVRTLERRMTKSDSR